MRIRRSDGSGPGILRVRRGRGFSYRWSDGRRVEEPEVLERISALVLPPAWNNVWICPWPNGHIQAIGTDAAGTIVYWNEPAVALYGWKTEDAIGKNVLDVTPTQTALDEATNITVGAGMILPNQSD